MYKEVALNCFRFLDFKSFEEVDRLTPAEYYLLMKACRLKRLDRNYEIHLQAWLTFAAKAEKSAGKGKSKPKYNKFEKFFDYEKELDKIINEKENRHRSEMIGRRIMEIQEGDDGGRGF